MGASAESDHLLTPFLLKGPNGRLPLRRGTCRAAPGGVSRLRPGSLVQPHVPPRLAAHVRPPRNSHVLTLGRRVSVPALLPAPVSSVPRTASPFAALPVPQGPPGRLHCERPCPVDGLSLTSWV